MNRDEVKLVFDNEADRDKVADQYGTYGNGVCSNYANIEKNDDSYESKYEIIIQRSEIEDFGRIGEDAKLYGAEVQTSIDD